ncbi:thermonuclease family protein [Microbacterium sp. C7(2022)]|uniref:thermonuclease family protein n=1 Tax=Microbacterium sp. C7(2022) TaxID=2992759 RepID=UPI00237A2EC2|nr:thermonuclease family protein [Microbacterium sp. C7(2022)]MDE0545252.1 thermonuclease family protein [Microbacterium sp. C7(2022)]
MTTSPRRRRRWTQLVCIAGGAIAVALAFLALTGDPQQSGFPVSSDAQTAESPQTAESQRPGASDAPARPTDAFPMTVEYVIDGDTIKATIDEPNEIIETSERISVRIIGIDTPEMRPTPECGAQEATDTLSALLPEGSTVWASPDREWYDRYDRALMYLWSDAGTFINLEMIARGDAVTLEVTPNTMYADLFAEAEADAREDSRGLWSACADQRG